jgi:hypothetical protein
VVKGWHLKVSMTARPSGVRLGKIILLEEWTMKEAQKFDADARFNRRRHLPLLSAGLRARIQAPSSHGSCREMLCERRQPGGRCAEGQPDRLQHQPRSECRSGAFGVLLHTPAYASIVLTNIGTFANYLVAETKLHLAGAEGTRR